MADIRMLLDFVKTVDLIATNSSNNQSQLALNQTLKAPLAITASFELAVCLIGVPANVMVIILRARLGRRDHRGNGCTRLHNNNHWFILGMTLADLLFTSLHSPMMFLWFLRNDD